MPAGLEHDEHRSRLIRKLASIGDLSTEETRALLELAFRLLDVSDGEDIVREGDRPTVCCLVLDGLLGRYKVLPSGKRQIMSFHTPGDIPDLQSLHLETLDHNIGAFARTRVAFIDHEDLRRLISRYPNLGGILWRGTLIDAAIFREWMVGLGRRTAHERIAHLLCEMSLRFRAIGIGDERSYPFPVTQAELADALGLTVVHVNRVLRSLRADGIVRMDSGVVSILDRVALEALAEFDAGYLHQAGYLHNDGGVRL